MSLLSRPQSAAALSEDGLKSASQRFSVEIIYKLSQNEKNIPKIVGLQNCINLVDLDFSYNVITKIEGLENCPSLKRLNLQCNKITKIEGIWHLTLLETLMLQGNQISKFEDLNLAEMVNLPLLKALYLQNLDGSQTNPVCSQPKYKMTVLAALPLVMNLDGERSPRTTGYMEFVEEVLKLTKSGTPAIPSGSEVPIPSVQPWFPPTNETDLFLQWKANPDFVQKHQEISKKVDECQMLNHVLKENIEKGLKMRSAGK
mmetsp:Transcript_20060/g.36061  ORF Transcript_20060/g.36061 Transcript_20060/m.36061 type:complete len:258 (-) Transcript_20060:1044-1817(-)